MKVDIIVPHVGEGIAEVALARWLKREGEAVKVGEPLFVVDIDKAELEVEAAEDGVLAEIRAPDGSSVMPLDVVGVLDVADR